MSPTRWRGDWLDNPRYRYARPAQRFAGQRRAVEIGTALGAKPRSKLRPISWREARPLHRRVGRLVAVAHAHPACQNHIGTGPRGTTSQLSEPHAAQNHTSTPDSRKQPHRRTTSSVYGRAQRAVRTTGARTTPAPRAPARRAPAERAVWIAPNNQPRHACRPHSPAAQRLAVQLPRARWERLQKANDLAREAVSCNGGLGRSLGMGFAHQEAVKAS